MANIVLASDLELFDGADALHGSDGTPVHFTEMDLTEFKITTTVCLADEVGVQVLFGESVGTTTLVWVHNHNSIRIRFNDGAAVTATIPQQNKELHEFCIEYIGGVASVYIDGVLVVTDNSFGAGKIFTLGSILGIRGDATYGFSGCMTSFIAEDGSGNKLLDFPINGNYGSSTITDTVSGVVGTLNDTTWWKMFDETSAVDEYYSTALACKSAWVVPMEEDQNVVNVDLDLPDVDDIFWNDYNIDPVFSFTITNQPSSGYTAWGMSTYPTIGISFKTRNYR